MSLDCVLGIGVLVDHLEFKTGRLAEQGNGPLRVLDPGKLDQDAVVALALKDRLADSELVDAVAHRLQRLAHGVVLNRGDLLVAQPVVLLDIATAAVQCQRFQGGEIVLHHGVDLGAGFLIVDRHHDPVIPFPGNPFEDDVLVAQQGVHLVDHAVESAFDRLVDLNPEDQMHPPLQVKPQMDGIKGFFPPIGKIAPGNGRRQRCQRDNQTEEDDPPPHF